MRKRTTLTPDDGTSAPIGEDVRRSGSAGAMQRQRAGSKRTVTVPSKRMGLRPGRQLDAISSLIDDVEGPLHR